MLVFRIVLAPQKIFKSLLLLCPLAGKFFRNSGHPGKERGRESGDGANHRAVWIIIPIPAGSLYIL